MQSFSDNSNNVWTVQITVATIKRVQALCNVNLLDVLDSKSHLLEKLSTDPILLCDVLFAICQQQAESANITDERAAHATAERQLRARACRGMQTTPPPEYHLDLCTPPRRMRTSRHDLAA